MTVPDWAAGGAVGMLPVLAFLGGLIALDGYKLVRRRDLAVTLLAGATIAIVCFMVNRGLSSLVGVAPETYSRYLAPLIEEGAKTLVILILIRTHRIGFLIDAAILGFAVGAGFSVVENGWYLMSLPEAPIVVWIVRGFGTAIMHGGTAALFAILAKMHTDRDESRGGLAYLPPFVAAAALHSLFNHFFVSTVVSTAIVLVVFPACLFWAFHRGESAMRRWLGAGFDADAELLDVIRTGQVSQSHIGSYLQSLREKFSGEVVSDMVCYLRLCAEVALRAKGELMMREHGFRTEPDDSLRETFVEMDYLEKNIGPTGLLALRPLFQEGGRNVWQARLLGR